MNTVDRALIDQTNAAFTDFRASGNVAMEGVIEWVNKGRAFGLHLHGVKDRFRQWEQLTLPAIGGTTGGDDGPRLIFSEAQGKMAMRLADKLPEPAQTPLEAIGAMKECAVLQEVLPLPDGHGPQQRHTHDATSTIITRAMEIQAAFNRDVRDQIRTWDENRRQNLRDNLRPLVEIYEMLG